MQTASTQTSWWNGPRTVLLLLCALVLFVGAGAGLSESHDACACPAMAGGHEHDASTEDASAGDDTHGSCACGAESPTDCQCELTPDRPSKTADAHAWTASPQMMGLRAERPQMPHPVSVAGFSAQTPPGNWLYGRPPPTRIYLLHRTLLM